MERLILVIFVLYGEWVKLVIVGAWQLVLWTSLMYLQRYILFFLFLLTNLLILSSFEWKYLLNAFHVKRKCNVKCTMTSSSISLSHQTLFLYHSFTLLSPNQTRQSAKRHPNACILFQAHCCVVLWGGAVFRQREKETKGMTTGCCAGGTFSFSVGWLNSWER